MDHDDYPHEVHSFKINRLVAEFFLLAIFEMVAINEEEKSSKL